MVSVVAGTVVGLIASLYVPIHSASTTILSNTCQIVALFHPLDPKRLLFVKAAVSHAVKAKSHDTRATLPKQQRCDSEETCSKSTCYVAYHPLCARAAGFCAELEDEDRMHLIPLDEDEENQCIRLLSFCKKHRPASTEHPLADERISQVASQYSAYVPPANPSGCARSEPYNYLGRRGRKEPEALAAASLKRSFVENRPYVVGGYRQNKPLGNTLPSSTLAVPNSSLGMEKHEISQLDASRSIVCMAEKYIYMRKTFRKRLAFGKSAIHGFGIFAKQPHRAGDMVIEYTGDLVRPPIADRREHLIYNSLVGAGTYMFRIDDERVIDATRAGSIAHLINHSCKVSHILLVPWLDPAVLALIFV
ncbi:hypothetical protein RJ639_042169 [Escallonia herrerae]|uniref:SET domain-containing protein n=1 Tax=Escallonia herrerae TaxID=1293975 RepID=A0AA88WEI2_9ASTE|nr:hypothetical protein RJ639_042169 [Escallonia herrerae]